MSRDVILRPVPVESPVHRLRAETKVSGLVLFSMGLAYHPEWWLIAVTLCLTAGVFLLARLPRAVIPRPPKPMLYALGFSGFFSALGGGEPFVAGLGLGGLLDLAQLVAVGLTLIFWAALLAWTTGLPELGAGLVRMIRPLRRVGVPADELGTAVTLTVRTIPLVASELKTTLEAWSDRPQPDQSKARFGMGPVVELVDVGATAVTTSYRRATELAGAMVARGGAYAPVPLPQPWHMVDAVVIAVAAVACVASFIFL